MEKKLGINDQLLSSNKLCFNMKTNKECLCIFGPLLKHIKNLSFLSKLNLDPNKLYNVDETTTGKYITE